MINIKKYHFLASSLVILLLFGAVQAGKAQQTDTTQTTKKLKLNRRSIQQPYHSERSSHGFLLTETGSYDVPEPTEYYTPPFTGQKSLDRAVAAYRKELEEGKGGMLLQFISKIAPFINNQFEFGVYQINDLPIVSRDNPLFKSYHSKQKRK